MARKAQCMTLEEFAFIFLDFGGWDMLRTNVDSLLVSQEEEAIRGADLTTAPLKVRVVRLELGGAEVEEIAGGSEEEEVLFY